MKRFFTFLVFSIFISTGYSSTGNDILEPLDCKSSSTYLNDTDTEAYEGVLPISANISSVTNIDNNNPIDVLSIIIEDEPNTDGVGDGLATKITNIRLQPHSTNTADWTNNIQGVVIDDGTNFITPSSVTITDTQIDITFATGDLTAPSDGYITVGIGIYLNTSNIEDEKILSFKVSDASHGFTADASGSDFAIAFGLAPFNSNDFTILVEATELRVQTQPTNVAQDAIMHPAVTIAYTDIHGNIDVSYDNLGGNTTSLSTIGTFDAAATTAVEAIKGIATFDNLIFSAQDIGLTLTATDISGLGASAVSGTFDVSASTMLVINEILADPANGPAPSGDANGDGTRHAYDDEFIELVNTNATPLDISGWTISDRVGLKHTFPASTIIPVNNSITIFGGGTPTNIPSLSQIATSGSLALNNTGDDVIIRNNVGTTMVAYTYASEGGDNQSLARSPDFTGAFVKHSTIATNPVLFSPGKDNTDGTVLPIILKSFTATKKQNTTLLQWQTATEINNDYMVIERSNDGRNFTTIGQVQGAGTSYELNNYSFVDEKPNTGINYYRLRQVDYDGKSEIHKTVSVVFGENGGTVQVYPTEVAAEINVVFPKITATETQLVIVDVTGKEWMRTTLAVGQSQYVLDVSSLVAGQFFLQVQNAASVEVARFVKL